MKNILQVKDLCYSRNGKEILRNINFTLNDRESLIIIGLNGCGKSTLLKCLCNYLNYKGSVKIDGEEIKFLKPKVLSKKITMLSQAVTINYDFKAKDVVSFGRYAYNESSKYENDKIINESMSILGISHLKNCYMSELSGGEAQKVFMARVMCQDSEIILLDEPSNNLDFKFYVDIVENLNVWFKNKIVISVLHDLNLVSLLNSNIMAIKDSQIYKMGSINEVFQNEILQNIYGFDVQSFMINSLKKWEQRNNNI